MGEGLKDLFKARASVEELGLEPRSFWLQICVLFLSWCEVSSGSHCAFPSVLNPPFTVCSPKMVLCTFPDDPEADAPLGLPQKVPHRIEE